MTEASTPDLPLWQCHKRVRAAKIHHVSMIGAKALLFFEPGQGSAEVEQAWLAKHMPRSGGYFVVYEDGYQSYSPAEAFEQGYRLVERGERGGSIDPSATITYQFPDGVDHVTIHVSRVGD